VDVDQPSADGHDPAASTNSGQLLTGTVAQSQVADREIEPCATINTDTQDSSAEPRSFGASSSVISITDDNDNDADDGSSDVVVVNESLEGSPSKKRMKKTVVSAWQNGDALKPIVEKALAQVTTFRRTGSVSSSNTAVSVTVLPSLSSQAAAIVAKPKAAPTSCTGKQSQGIAAKPVAANTTLRAYTGRQAHSVAAKLVDAKSTFAASIGSQSQAVASEPSSQSRITPVTQPQLIGHAGISTTATQADIPTARVVGRIISMRHGSSQQVASITAAHRTMTAGIRSATATSATSVASASATVAALPVESVLAPSGARTAANKPRNRSLASSNNPTSSSSGQRPRRLRRPRRVTLLRPEDLYEISSQIVAEVLARNRPPDVITCTDDDDDDVIAIRPDADTDPLDARSQSPSSGDDVMVLDEISGVLLTRRSQAPAVTSGAEVSATYHSRAPAVTSVQTHFTQKSRAAVTSTQASGGAGYSRPPEAAPSTSGVSSSLSRKRLLIDPPSATSSTTASAAQKKLLISPVSRSLLAKSSSHQGAGTASSLPDDVAIFRASMLHAADDTDDVVCCDDGGSENTIGDGRAKKPAPANRPAMSAAVGDESDNVICCDETDSEETGRDGTVQRPTATNPILANRTRAAEKPANASRVSANRSNRAAAAVAAANNSDDVVCFNDKDSENTVCDDTVTKTTVNQAPTNRVQAVERMARSRVTIKRANRAAAATGENDDVVCCDDQDSWDTAQDVAIERTAAANAVSADRASSVGRRTTASHSTVAAAVNDDILICDEQNSEEETIPDGRRAERRAAANVVPATTASTSARPADALTNQAGAAATDDGDDDVLVCDTAAPIERRSLSISRRQRAAHVVHSLPVNSAASVVGSGWSAASTSAAISNSTAPSIPPSLPRGAATMADEVVVVETNDDSSSSSLSLSSNKNTKTTQGDARRRSSKDASVIILD